MIKFRCSNVGLLLTEPKLKSDKEACNLSETAKTMIEEKWLFDNFGYKEDILTDEMLKGILSEQDAMQLVQDVLGGAFRKRSKKYLENDYLTGTPDIILDDAVEDTKCSFSVKTFFNAECTKLYETQLRCYMALTGVKKARLIYCLVETPAEIIEEQKKKLYYKFGCDEENADYIKMCLQIDKNHDISMIQKEKRIKVFEFEHEQEFIDKLYLKIEKAREYYNSLTL